MLAPTRASDEYEAQKRLTVATIAAVRSQWRRMGADWDSSFATVGPRMAAILTAAQLGSARQGAQYVPDVLEEQGMHPEPVGRVNTRAFAGRAADGRDLTSLLSLSVLRSRVGGSLDAGQSFLDTVVETEIADAHRGAIQVATVARPRTGYVRMVNSPCCKDCAVQAGKFFRSNTGFLRHPHCKCYHLPTTDPGSRYATYPDPSEITGLTDAERKALEAGGDYSQVLNAGRGASRNKMTTAEGTTRRGVAGSRLRGRRRLTPDGIYAIASDEAEARRLLTAHGYLL